MSSIWNNGISIGLFGESHGVAVGVSIDNLPSGVPIDLEQLQQMMRRRQAKSDGTTTSRIEPDLPEILSGLHQGSTNGTPLTLLIRNTNTHSAHYENLRQIPRPGHADYTGLLRYHGAADMRGGGHFSGRLTAPLVAAGAICAQILTERYGVDAAAFLRSVGEVDTPPVDSLSLCKTDIQKIRSLPFPALDEETQAHMIQSIKEAHAQKDSIGGVVECIALGMPAGIGSPMFSGIENQLAQLLFGIPAVKGVEFGEGFGSSKQRGSEHNDAFRYDENGEVVTTTNRHGGILGGISSGMPIVFRVAIKPTPSIALTQQSVDLSTKTDTTLSIVGRHDPCIAVRAVPVVEACCTIGLLGALVNGERVVAQKTPSRSRTDRTWQSHDHHESSHPVE